MKTSSLVVILLVSCGRPTLGSLAIIQKLGSLVLPFVCDSIGKNVIPDMVQDLYDEAADGLICHPHCRTISGGDLQFEGTCDASTVDDDQKENYCKAGLQVIRSAAKFAGCPKYDCSVNENGDLFYSVVCPAPAIPLLSSFKSKA